MNKISNSQLISDVADKTSLTKKDVKAVISALGDTIVAHTNSGSSVAFDSVGTFKPSKTSARTAKVPGTDKTVDVPAGVKLAFKQSKTTKNFLNQ